MDITYFQVTGTPCDHAAVWSLLWQQTT